MTHKPPKPPEGSDAGREKAAGVTRRALLNLFRGTRDKRAESDGKPPEASVAHDVRERIREQKGPHRRGVLAAGVVGAAVGLVVGALPGTTGAAPQNAPASSGTSGWPGGFVERYKIPEWGAEELERMADAFSLLSGYRTNPSFWRYVTNHKMESAVYEAIDHVLKQPELFHYKDEGDGVIRIMPRGALWGIPPDLAIEIKGGLEKGRLTRIGINGANLEVKPHASLSWEDYKDVLKAATDEYWDTLKYLNILNQIANSSDSEIGIKPAAEKIKGIKKMPQTMSPLPPLLRKSLDAILARTKIGLLLNDVLAFDAPDAKKVQAIRRLVPTLSKKLREVLEPILASGANDAQKIQRIKKGADGMNEAKLQKIRDWLKKIDLSGEGRVLYASYDDYSAEMLGLQRGFQELLRIRKGMGYLDAATENPNENAAMKTFLDGSNFIAYPMMNSDGSVVIRFSAVELKEDIFKVKIKPVIALSPDGRVMTPKDDDSDGTPDWKNYDLPDGKTLRDLVHEKYKAQLSL